MQWPAATDLAPGDASSAQLDLSPFRLTKIQSTGDPLFELVYQKLWAEFGEKGEMESPRVLAFRMTWDPRRILADVSLMYELVLVRCGEEIAAVLDYGVLVTLDPQRKWHAVAHFSHLLIEPAFRRTGLAGWLRALPIVAARTALRPAAGPELGPITLVGEVEFSNEADPTTRHRLASFEKAGFLAIDPAAMPYAQPDFRDAFDIDYAGGPTPLPMSLIVRQVGRESERAMPASQAKWLMGRLYDLFGRTMRPADIAPCIASLASLHGGDRAIALLLPTA